MGTARVVWEGADELMGMLSARGLELEHVRAGIARSRKLESWNPKPETRDPNSGTFKSRYGARNRPETPETVALSGSVLPQNLPGISPRGLISPCSGLCKVTPVILHGLVSPDKSLPGPTTQWTTKEYLTTSLVQFHAGTAVGS